jgi:hypothetical protein
MLLMCFCHASGILLSGPSGHSLRLVVGTYSEETAHVIIATMWLVTGLSQVLFEVEANLFTFFHKLLYLMCNDRKYVGFRQENNY